MAAVSSGPKPWVTVDIALQRLEAADKGQPRRRFVILGAGLAGLAAGLELQKLGHTVEIYEASERVGGRAHTRHFDDGSYGELGAMRIPDTHDYTVHYIKTLGLKTRPFINSNARGFFDLRGKVLRVEEFKAHLDELYPGLSPAERNVVLSKGPDGLLGLVVGPILNSLSRDEQYALLYGHLTTQKLRDLDHQSVRDVIVKNLSPEAVALIGGTESVDELWSWSLAMFLRDEIIYSSNLSEIIGGTEKLPKAVEKCFRANGGTIYFCKKVVAIEAGGSKSEPVTTVHFADGQALEVREPNRVFCTLPFPVLRQLKLPGLDPAKVRAIYNMEYTSSTKVLIRSKKRFWELNPLPIVGGRSTSDRLSRQTYYPSDNAPAGSGSPEPLSLPTVLSLGPLEEKAARTPQGPANPAVSEGPGVLLASYSWNDNARQLGNLGEKEMADLVMKDLTRIHSELPDYAEGTKTMFWDRNPYARGAFAVTPPGDIDSYFELGRRPAGNLYFGGEHVSIAQGWMQGALESGLREALFMIDSTAVYPPPLPEEPSPKKSSRAGVTPNNRRGRSRSAASSSGSASAPRP